MYLKGDDDQTKILYKFVKKQRPPPFMLYKWHTWIYANKAVSPKCVSKQLKKKIYKCDTKSDMWEAKKLEL